MPFLRALSRSRYVPEGYQDSDFSQMTGIRRKQDLRHCSREELAQFILAYSVDTASHTLGARERLVHLYGATDPILLHRCQKAERDNLNLQCRVEVLEMQLQWQQQQENQRRQQHLFQEYQWQEQDVGRRRKTERRVALDEMLSQGSSDADARLLNEEQEQKQKREQKQKQKRKQEQKQKQEQEQKQKQEREQKQKQEQEQKQKREQKRKQEQEQQRRQLQRDREHEEELKRKRDVQKQRQRRRQVAAPAALGQVHVVTDDEAAELETRRKATLREDKKREEKKEERWKPGDAPRNDETQLQPRPAFASVEEPSAPERVGSDATATQHKPQRRVHAANDAFAQQDDPYHNVAGMADESALGPAFLGIYEHPAAEAETDGFEMHLAEVSPTSEKLSTVTSSGGGASKDGGASPFASDDGGIVRIDSADGDISPAAAIKWGFPLTAPEGESSPAFDGISVGDSVEREAPSFAFADGGVAPTDSLDGVSSPLDADGGVLRVDSTGNAAEIEWGLSLGASAVSEMSCIHSASDDVLRAGSAGSRHGALRYQDFATCSSSPLAPENIDILSASRAQEGPLENEIDFVTAPSGKRPVASVSAEQPTPICDAAEGPQLTDSDTVVGAIFDREQPLKPPVSLALLSSRPIGQKPASTSPVHEQPTPSQPKHATLPPPPVVAPPPFADAGARKTGRRARSLAAPVISMEVHGELFHEDARPSMSPDHKGGYDSAATSVGGQGPGMADYLFGAPLPETASIDSKGEAQEYQPALPFGARLPVDIPSSDFLGSESPFTVPAPPIAEEKDPAADRRMRLRHKLAEAPEIVMEDTASPRKLLPGSKFFPPRGDGYESASVTSASSESSVWFLDYFLPTPEQPVDPVREALKDLPLLPWGVPLPIDLPPLFHDEDDVSPPEEAAASVDEGLQSPIVAEDDVQTQRPRRVRAQVELPAIARPTAEEETGWFGLW
eukprot:GEMP01012016.1.p1 GENE.GEMP01012016.1~~GEMP01012016.1.p1  ORF type:complete len:959 (+),score=278.19 GEMP01012016.1:154-3030(+)